MFNNPNSPNPPNPSSMDLESPPNPQIPAKPSPSLPQELTLSYFRDNPKLSIPENDKSKLKGKEIVTETPNDDEQRWVERDFLQLSSGNSSKREPVDSIDVGGCEKKAKVDALNLSLAPPSLSLSINSMAQRLGSVKKSCGSGTFVTNSEDYGVSMSYSGSVPFSHNISCSLTRNSTENCDFSRGENDLIWNAGEGTNGSVHSRFKPVGDGSSVAFSIHNKELNGNGVCRGNSSENVSFFPSELPARFGKSNGVASLDSGRNVMLSRPDKVLRELVTEKVPIMAQMLNEFPNEILEGLRDFLRKLMEVPEKKDEFSALQRRLERRSDLTLETLSKAHKTQLEIFVAVKTGLRNYVSGKLSIPSKELVEIFLLTRCRNVSCKSLLPVDDCDCKICSSKKGFCSACMCPVCWKFDCAANTCSWVGCDVCSHWCHAVCGIEKNLIKPGPSLKGPMGMTEMQFHCPGCDHASEMFGFVKDVFNVCAKEWGLETLIKELDCVRKIFRASEDFEGKGLHAKAEEILHMLTKNVISSKDACDSMLQFFKYGVTEFSVTGSSSKSILAQVSQNTETFSIQPSAPITLSKSAISFKPSSSMVDKRIDTIKSDAKALSVEPRFTLPKEDGSQTLETIVKCKEAEAKLFQRLADEARREVESYRQIARSKMEKLEEEYATKLAKLCLQETEERQKKKLEELKFLENSNCDYHNMKLRMQAEIATLLERMEAMKKMWV